MLEVIGIICIVQGFGSLIVKELGGGEWFLMAWATPYSPWANIAIGVLGIFLSGAGTTARRRSKRS